MTTLEKAQVKIAKSKWRRAMKKLYPDFTPRKWASTTYRINHPQMVTTK